MPFLGCEFTNHKVLMLIVIGTLEDAKLPHTFNSLFIFTLRQYHLSDCVSFEKLFLRHIHVSYTNIFSVIDYFFILQVVHMYNLIYLFLLGTIYHHTIQYLSMSFFALVFKPGHTCLGVNYLCYDLKITQKILIMLCCYIMYLKNLLIIQRDLKNIFTTDF